MVRLRRGTGGVRVSDVTFAAILLSFPEAALVVGLSPGAMIAMSSTFLVKVMSPVDGNLALSRRRFQEKTMRRASQHRTGHKKGDILKRQTGLRLSLLVSKPGIVQSAED